MLCVWDEVNGIKNKVIFSLNFGGCFKVYLLSYVAVKPKRLKLLLDKGMLTFTES